MKQTSSLAIAILLCAGMAFAQVDMMIGARGYGMGGAYAAIVDDASAVYWNPGALGLLAHPQFMESNWLFQDVSGLNVNYTSLVVPIEKICVVGGGWLLQHASVEEGDPNLGVTTSSVYHNTFSLALGRRLLEHWWFVKEISMGLDINRYWMKASDGGAAGLGFDAGLQMTFPHDLALAVVGRSLATDLQGEPVDPQVRCGLGYTPLFGGMHRVSVALDASYLLNRGYTNSQTLAPATGNVQGFGGVEYALVYNGLVCAVRGGANATMYLANPGRFRGYSLGLGLQYLGYSIQYAFADNGNNDNDGLGYSHRLDLVLTLDNLAKK